MALNELHEPAVTFLKTNGHKTIVSLGCGRWINRIDNHLRLMAGLNLSYYVGIDYADKIGPDMNEVFMDPAGMNALLTHYFQGSPDRFWKAVHFFPGTRLEKLSYPLCRSYLPACISGLSLGGSDSLYEPETRSAGRSPRMRAPKTPGP